MATAAYVCNCKFDSSKRTIEILPSLGEFEKIPKTQRMLIEAQAQKFCSTLDIQTICFQLAISIDVHSLQGENVPLALSAPAPAPPTYLPSLSSFPPFGSLSFFRSDPVTPNIQTKALSSLSLNPSSLFFQPIKASNEEIEFAEQTSQNIPASRAYPNQNQKAELTKYRAESKNKEWGMEKQYKKELDPKRLFNKKNVTITTSTKEKDLNNWIKQKFENTRSIKCRTCPFFHDQRIFMIHFHANRNCTYAVSLIVWDTDSKAQAFIYNLISTKEEESVVFPKLVVTLLTCPVFVKINLRNYPGSSKPMSFFSVSIFSSLLSNFHEPKYPGCYFREMLKTFTKRKKIYICSLDGWKGEDYSRTTDIESATILDSLNLITFLLLEKVSCSWKELSESLTDTSFEKLKELQKLNQPKERRAGGGSRGGGKDHRFQQQDCRSQQNKYGYPEGQRLGVFNQRKAKTGNKQEKNWKEYESSTREEKEDEWVTSDLEIWNTSTSSSFDPPKNGSSSQLEPFQQPKLETWAKTGDDT